MTAPDTARPTRRRPWGDLRFLLGLLLIGASVAGVWSVVSAARQTVPVLAAAHTIVPGSVIAEEDVTLVDVALGQMHDSYLDADAPAVGLVAARTIERGELIPRAALGDADADRTTRVVLRSTVDLPASVGPGALVEVWQAPYLDHDAYDAPRILVADATVVSVTRDESMMGGGAASLEVVIARSDVAGVLTALSDRSALSVVPQSGAAE